MSKERTVYKILVIGPSYVGKTSLLSVLSGHSHDACWMDRTQPTLTPEFSTFSLAHPTESGCTLEAIVWDTAGQERYQAMTKSHYRRAHGALLVFDVTNPASFESIFQWVRDVREHVDGMNNFVIMLVENKIDLLEKSELAAGGVRNPAFVPESNVLSYVESNGFMYARTTAKADAEALLWGGQSLKGAFTSLVYRIHENQSLFHSGGPMSSPIRLHENAVRDDDSACCA